jgi:HlyD family secretion protein
MSLEAEMGTRNSPRSRLPRKAAGLLIGACAVASIGYLGRETIPFRPEKADNPLTSTAHRATLRIVVTERGNIESTVTVDGICELFGHQNKIIELVPEGTRVELGQVVCRFDSSEIDKNIAQQEIKAKQARSKIDTSKQQLEIDRNKAEADIIAAEVEKTVAGLTKEMYEKGTNPAEIDEAQAKIQLAKKDFEKTQAEYEQMEGLVKKGFRSPSQLRQLESSLAQFKHQKSSEERKLTVKKEYEYKKTTAENTAKVNQASKKVDQMKATLRAQLAKNESEVEAATSTFTIEDQQLKEYQKQKDRTVMKAGQGGILAYANDRWYDPSSQIREGAMVYSRQKIFTIPDLSKLQVKVNVHESLVKKIKPGQKAEVRVDSSPNLVLIGTVKTVSNLADSNRNFMSGGGKEYPTVVTIDETPPDAGLKPGMTSEVKIKVNEIADALLVPIQAVAEHKGDFFAFVATDDGYEPRKVKPGETDEKYVEILDGLKEGERVALDARNRASVEFKDDEEEKESEKSKPTSPSPGAAPAPG